MNKILLLTKKLATESQTPYFDEWNSYNFEDEKANQAIKKFKSGAEKEREKFIKELTNRKNSEGKPAYPRKKQSLPPHTPKLPNTGGSQAGSAIKEVAKVKPMSTAAKAALTTLALAGAYGGYKLLSDPINKKVTNGPRNQPNR